MKIFFRFPVLLLLIFLLSIGIRLYWAQQKEGMSMDEVASFSISEYDGAWELQPYVMVPDTATLTGEEAKRFYFIHDPSVKGMLHDLRSMWYNVYDRNHTNFYYSILRVFFTGSDTADVKVINMRGIALNLIFFTLSFLVMLKLLLLYYSEKKWLILLTMLCFSTVVGGISNTLNIRPYELQMLTVLLLAYWLSVVTLRMKQGTWRYTLRNFLLTAVLLTTVLLTGYFMVGLVLIFGVYILYESLRYRNATYGIPFFIGAALFALLLCWCCYQSYFLGFSGDSRISHKIIGLGVRGLICDTLHTWYNLITGGVLYLPVLAILLVGFLVGRGKKSIPPIFLPALIYTIAVRGVSPFVDLRYMVAVVPLLLLLIPAVGSALADKRMKVAYAVMISSLYLVKPTIEGKVGNLYKRNSVLELLSEKKGKVYLVQQRFRTEILPLIPMLYDDVTYHISDTLCIDSLRSGDVVFIRDSTIQKPGLEKKGHFSWYNGVYKMK